MIEETKKLPEKIHEIKQSQDLNNKNRKEIQIEKRERKREKERERISSDKENVGQSN